ncbi:hypothetical protein [Rhodococcus sp. MS13]|uniref:hypothetical protein n=1 Tax=Rhodococcus sp. MS13 TaxID=2579940 RepID=UPI00156221A4|nr:hypothetical protein [Rhodococcus sp. MS13]NRH34062.1 hypothetical protein [Rhodococcus sp. MS13]
MNFVEPREICSDTSDQKSGQEKEMSLRLVIGASAGAVFTAILIHLILQGTPRTMEQDYMGSKKKAESKARVSLARRLRTVEFDSVWELVFAAGASPAERSRWVAVGSLASAALASEIEGKRRASSEELNTLLRACENEDSRIG